MDAETREALTEAIQHVRRLWGFFLSYLATLAALASTTTHEALLMDSPLQLPLFQLGVPLVLFYVTTPALLVLMHLYLLLRLHDLRVRANHLAPTAATRFELPAFDYFSVTGGLIRHAGEQTLSRVLATVSIFIAPVLLLLFLERQFLPYHGIWITWFHRLLIFVDLGVILLLQFGFAPQKPSGRAWITAFCATACIAFVATFVICFPGEIQDVFWPARPAGSDVAERFWLPRSLDLRNKHLAAHLPPPELAAAFETRQQSANSTDDLQQQALDAQDARSLAERLYGEPLRLQHRNLDYANLSGVTMIGADFEKGSLRHALLTNSQLTNVSFEGTNLSNADLNGSNLRGAVFSNVDAAFLNLEHSDLLGATFGRSVLIGADFAGASLDAAVLQSSNFDGASFAYASAEGTEGSDNSFLGADFRNLSESFASIWFSDYSGADFTGAALSGGMFVDSNLSYADLNLDWTPMPPKRWIDGKSDPQFVRIQEARRRDAFLAAAPHGSRPETTPPR